MHRVFGWVHRAGERVLHHALVPTVSQATEVGFHMALHKVAILMAMFS